MTVSKLNPWNWLKREREQDKDLPVNHVERGSAVAHPLDQFHREFDHMVESMFGRFGFPRSPFAGEGWPSFKADSFKPKVDISGTPKEYVIEADLPGIEEKDIDIQLNDDVLVLSAERKKEEKTEDKGYYRVERSFGSFRRVLNVPEDADRENITASFKNGTLCIRLPRLKAVEPAPRKIPIGSAQH